jgi:hypothetical protein
MANNYLINKSSLYSPQSRDTKSYIDSMRRPFTMNIKTLPRINDKQPQTGISVSLRYVITGYVDEGYVDDE